MKTLMLVAAAVLIASAVDAPTLAADTAACDRLAATLKLPNAKVTAAQAVAAGRFVEPGATRARASSEYADLPAFCRVELTLTPSSDSAIKSEVWLPESGWNGKFQQVGNGAWAGSIQYGALAAALKRGYAAASTDAGHTGTDASFALGHPEKLIDFGYRAVHDTAAQGKKTITAFYGKDAQLAYFNGCSGGGRMAFQEAQRFPADFDAILAGAPGYDRVNQSVQMLMNAKATLDRPESMIPSSKYPMIHRAAVAACDADDGLKDGLISDPLNCRFDPKVLECKSGDAADCLTSAQLAAATRIYSGVKHPRTGAQIFPGLEPGSELSWGGPAGGPQPLAVAGDLFKFVVFKDPRWDFRSFDLERDYDAVHRIDSLDLSPTSPDLKAFAARGGKLLVYHGWGDQNVAPRSSVNYHARLVETTGRARVDESVRMFFAPGMAHCGGGEGPNTFDALTPLEEWREHGKAPTQIIASHMNASGAVDRTRPLCPYPQIATYKGSGSIDQAANFVCAAPAAQRSQASAPPEFADLVDHVHLAAPDQVKAVAWYQQQFGGQAMTEGPDRLMFGQTRLIFQRNEMPQPSAGSVLDHVGFSVADLDAAMKQFASNGVKITAPVRDVPGLFKLAFIEDPWGTRIEVVQDAQKLGLHHVHVRGPDPAATLAWYVEKFGGKTGKLKGQIDGIQYGDVWVLAQRGDAVPSAGHAFDHLGFRAVQLDPTVGRLKDKGVKVTAEPRALTLASGTAMRIAFIEGIDGVRIELVQR